MNELLTKQNLEYQAKTREIAQKYIKPVALELDLNQTYPWEIVKHLQDAGLMGVWIPKEYGGHSGGVMNLVLIVEELSRACGGIGVGFAVNALGSFPIILGGTEEQKQRFLPDVAAGKKLVAFGLSEKSAGSDAGSLICRAWKDGEHYVLDGEKKWNTNGTAASTYTIYASTNPERGGRGISAFIVEKGAEGFTIPKEEDKLGIRCIGVAELLFDKCKIPADQLLGGTEGRGFMNAMMTLDRARPGVAAQALGLAQGALDLTLEYVATANLNGESVSSSQGIQFMLSDMATQIEAARRLTYAAAQAIDANAKGVSKLAAMSKLFASDVAMKVTTMATEIFGELGIIRDTGIEKYFRDAKITQIYEGTNQIQRLVIGRTLLKEAASKA
ncbi:MAG: acyl-CoA dehydrogenase [Calditrichaeota bacterium]|nr:MAG: acyl-CoA dehydrogenase [Calditrichota bacterium]